MDRRKLKRALQAVGGLTVNKFVVCFVRRGLPLPPVTPGSVMVIVAAGRRTGRRRATPVGFVRVGANRLLAVAEHGSRSDWFRNASAAGRVEVWIDGRRRAGTVRLLDDEDPAQVLRQIKSRVMAASNRLLWHRPQVVEVRLEDEAGQL